MALDIQRKEFPFIQGIDTKSDPKTVDDFSLMELENAVFTTKGALSLRNGFKQLASPPLLPASVLPQFPGLVSANELTTFGADQGNELLAMGSGLLASYNSSRNTWASRGPLRAIKSTARVMVADNQQQTHPDVASLRGTTVYAYEAANLGSVNTTVRAIVVDEATGSLLVSNAIGVAGSKPKCVASGNYLYVFFLDVLGTSLLWYRFSAQNPTAAPVSGTLINAGINGSTPYFAVRAYGSSGLVLTYVDGSGNVQVAFADGLPLVFGQMGNVNRPAVQVVAGGGGITALNLCVVGTLVVVLYAIFSTPNTNVGGAVYNPDLSVSRAPGTLANVSPGQVFALTGTTTNGNNTNVSCFYEIYQGASPAPAYNARVRKVTFPVTAGGATDSAFVRSVGLLTEAFTDALSGPVVGVVFDSITQPTAFFIDVNMTVVAKALQYRAGGIVNYSRLSSVALVSNTVPFAPGKWITAVCGRGRVVKGGQGQGNGQVTYQPKNVARVQLDFTSEEARSAQLGQTLHIVGGSASTYDGYNDANLGSAVSEDGFHLYPEQPGSQTQTVGVTLTQQGKNGATQQIYSLVFPVDYVGLPPASSASRIRPGEYIILYGDVPAHRCYIYFNIAGQGSNPTLAGFDAVIQVSLGVSDNQFTVASKVAQAINSAMLTDANGIYLTATAQPDNSVKVATLQQSSAANLACAVGDTQLGITTTVVGNGGVQQQTRFTFPAGKWIRGGQYFILYGFDAIAGRAIPVCHYFTVDGLGSAPSLSGITTFNPIAVLSTDPPLTVATAAKNSVVAVLSGGNALWTGVVSGPVVDFTDFNNGSVFNATNGTVGGVSLTPGATSVAYLALYTWLDGRSKLWRSAPSRMLVVPVPAQGDATNSGGIYGPSGAFYSNTIPVPTLRVTRKSGVRIELYRCEFGSGLQAAPTFYKLGSVSNDLTVDSVSFSDTTLDTDLRSGELIYTTGGTLPNLPPPPCSLICTWQGRLVVVDSENPTTLWLSQPNQDGLGTGFSDLLTVPVDEAGGDITAIWVQDEKLVIAKRTRLFFMVGDGPDFSGQQNNWIRPQRVETDTGCNNPDSVVSSQKGTFFQSDKGVYLLSRAGTEVLDIGRPAIAFGSIAITDAVMHPTSTQVRFFTSTGLALFYDYEAEQWGTLTNHNAAGVAVWSNTLCYITADGQVRQETPGLFVDQGGEWVTMRIVTSWIRIAGPQGFGHVRKVHVLGEYRSPHKLALRCAFDNDPATAGAIAYDPQPEQGANLYGSASPFGTGPFGGSLNPNSYQFRWFMPRQKCTSVRFEIETIPSGGSGEAVQLSGLMLELGIKQANKPAVSRSIG